MQSGTTRYLEVRLRDVNLRRAGRRVLKSIRWRLRPGERWVLVGANGSGKTQLLKLIAGTVWPAPSSRPTLQYAFRKELHHTPCEIRDHIAYLGAERQDKYQRYGWNMRAEEVVGTGLHRSDIPLIELSRDDRQRVRRALEAFDVGHLARRPFLSLSYGERRLILLARALISRPRLLLLDEVFNGLDEANRARLQRWLARQRSARPWVLATHRLEEVPASATHALVLSQGRIVYAGRLRRAGLAAARPPPRAPAERAPSGITAGRAPVLVRLKRARVYLEQRCVLTGISLTVRAGEFWVIHGKNGSGKTTLLRTLYGDHGVAVGGSIERAGTGPGVPLEVFRKQVGLVAPHLQAEYPRALTVAEVVQSGRHASIGLNRAPSATDRAGARRALRLLGLARVAGRTLAELSYGESRRVLFARALVRNPRLLLLDEPLTGLDSATHRELTQRVLSAAASGMTVVVAAHTPQEWRAYATHEIELSAGRARYCGPVIRESQARRCVPENRRCRNTSAIRASEF